MAIDRVRCVECGGEYNRLHWEDCPHCTGEIDNPVVLQPVHLGTGKPGIDRRRALETLAAEAGHLWNGKPSVGRWLVALADEELSK